MDVDLNDEQSAQLELIAIHAGKSPAQVLVDAALSLLRREVQDLKPYPGDPPLARSQDFMNEAELEARFARILRR